MSQENEKKIIEIPGALRSVRLPEALSLSEISESGQCFRASVAVTVPAVPTGQSGDPDRKLADSGGARQKERAVYRFVTGREVLFCAQKGPRTLLVSADPRTWKKVWAPYFDLGRKYEKIETGFLTYVERTSPELLPYFTEVIREGSGIRILRQDPWEVLITFLISQRKSIPAIRRAVELLCARYGEDAGSAAGIRLFPAPEALLSAGPEGLKACGIGYRVPYLLDAARKTVSGELDPAALEKLSDEELFSRLLSVFGIGKKVADCVMLYGYGRVGRAPEDVWVKRIREQRFAGADLFPVWNAAGFPAGILQQYLFSHAVHHRAAYRKNAGT